MSSEDLGVQHEPLVRGHLDATLPCPAHHPGTLTLTHELVHGLFAVLPGDLVKNIIAPVTIEIMQALGFGNEILSQALGLFVIPRVDLAADQANGRFAKAFQITLSNHSIDGLPVLKLIHSCVITGSLLLRLGFGLESVHVRVE